MMWDAAPDKVREHGNHVLMGHALRQLSFNDATQRWTVTASTDEGTRTINAAHVISSAPMRELAGALHPLPATLPEALEPQISRLPDRRADVRSPDLFPDNWIYIHDPKVKVGRMQNFRSWSPEMVPDPDDRLPRPRIFLLRGRRAVVVARRRPGRAGHARDGAARPVRSRPGRRRRGRPPGKGLSGL